jgi:hypothetical protein
MAINLSNRPVDILLQWRHIPSFRKSGAKWFAFRDVSDGKGWEGYSSVGIGVRDIQAHGSFVLIVKEKKDYDGERNGKETLVFEYGKV